MVLLGVNMKTITVELTENEAKQTHAGLQERWSNLHRSIKDKPDGMIYEKEEYINNARDAEEAGHKLNKAMKKAGI
jgi:hypothetical protein